MNRLNEPEAWVQIPTEEEVAAKLTPDEKRGGYDSGFIPAMGRLLLTHDRIGPAFGALFREIMFEPGCLTRQEREMVATVTAAAQDCHY